MSAHKVCHSHYYSYLRFCSIYPSVFSVVVHTIIYVLMNHVIYSGTFGVKQQFCIKTLIYMRQCLTTHLDKTFVQRDHECNLSYEQLTVTDKSGNLGGSSIPGITNEDFCLHFNIINMSCCLKWCSLLSQLKFLTKEEQEFFLAVALKCWALTLVPV